MRVESHRKTVQHLEGGIIAELTVGEGDGVARDQVLIRLDPTQAEARYEAVRNRYQSLSATEAAWSPSARATPEFAFQRS